MLQVVFLGKLASLSQFSHSIFRLSGTIIIWIRAVILDFNNIDKIEFLTNSAAETIFPWNCSEWICLISKISENPILLFSNIYACRNEPQYSKHNMRMCVSHQSSWVRI
ncbi:hypothetical protein LOAG_05112 [Loa loa]|uniref:Uncharacterized protein n=1 Tax=Loa loa TaxID=7209 RepID=A0A1S0U2D7_LOALO|nr:hypothetical protein LOAG_05112 [Loa loa]EFO23378.1 hypothetical protein LOAG_05112 [Loa loa]